MSSLKVSPLSVSVHARSLRGIEAFQHAHYPSVDTGHLITVERTLDAPAPSVHYYLHLIQKLSSVRAAQRGPGVFVFTAANAGDGVSFVVKSLARELTRATEEPVLTVPAATLGEGLCTMGFSDAEPPGPEQGVVYAVTRSCPGAKGWEARHLADNLNEIRRQFGWVLNDCPSLRASDQALALAPLTGGVVFVVAADATRRAEIVRARRQIELSSGNLLGFVLNKRTYPVPDFLYRRL